MINFKTLFTISLALSSTVYGQTDFWNRNEACRLVQNSMNCSGIENAVSLKNCYLNYTRNVRACSEWVKRDQEQRLKAIQDNGSSKTASIKKKASEVLEKNYEIYSGKHIETIDKTMMDFIKGSQFLRDFMGVLNPRILPQVYDISDKTDAAIKKGLEIYKQLASSAPDSMKSYEQLIADFNKLLQRLNVQEHNYQFEYSHTKTKILALQYDENRTQLLAALENTGFVITEIQSMRSGINSFKEELAARKDALTQPTYSLSTGQIVLNKIWDAKEKLKTAKDDDKDGLIKEIKFLQKLCGSYYEDPSVCQLEGK
ncbi:hypothetical protein ACJVC5_18815 [Peredibacter sp. HCB2-198]|uniref:hypothetical protein n=1 Tax=Peredibacter sp. HCB2-198 TaxID=3383025 RepID=UPI0038B653F2